LTITSIGELSQLLQRVPEKYYQVAEPKA